MQEYLKYNLTTYLYEKDKAKIWFITIISISLVIIFLIIMFFKIYDVENINGQVVCDNKCHVIYYHYTNFDTYYDFVKINNKKYKIQNVEYSELSLDNQNNTFQEVALDLEDYKGNNNEIVKVKLYKNKMSIAKKIWQIVVER
jgi:hypothetical protein